MGQDTQIQHTVVKGNNQKKVTCVPTTVQYTGYQYKYFFYFLKDILVRIGNKI